MGRLNIVDDEDDKSVVNNEASKGAGPGINTINN